MTSVKMFYVKAFILGQSEFDVTDMTDNHIPVPVLSLKIMCFKMSAFKISQNKLKYLLRDE